MEAFSSAMSHGHNERRARPARKQISYGELEEIRHHAEHMTGEGMIYNVWYNKMSGGDTGHGPESKTRSKTRCDIARDAGYTRADMRIQASAGGVSDTTYVCLFFARGCCPKGEECLYLHRLPRPYEVADQGRDIFGREKHGSYRDDMGGVGSMLRVNKTLYVGRINEETSLSFRRAAANPADNYDDTGSTPTSKIVRRHFSEWGDIEHVRVMVGRGIAFVTYKYEANAQFAKEAMMHQTLDHDEVLNVRWAAEDPRSDGEARDAAELRELAEKRIAEVERTKRTSDDAEDERAKRQRMLLSQQQMAQLDEENRRGWEEIHGKAKTPILSAQALESLKVLRPTRPTSALENLAAYDSD